MMTINVDKENANVCYNDEKHVYWDKIDNEKYISVTTLIHEFSQPFDSEFFSKYKALERIMTPSVFKLEKGGLLKTRKIDDAYLNSKSIDNSVFQETVDVILAEWKEKNKVACDRGTEIHAMFENLFYQGNFDVVKDLNITKDYICKKNKYDILNVDKGVFPELMLDYKSPDGKLRIAGQSDIIIKTGNEIYVLDFKTNKKLDEKSYFNPKTKKSTMMLYPLNNLMDCNMVHYQLQLSTYAWMIKQAYPEMVIKSLVIIHIDHDGVENRYELEYIPKDVENMINFYKRELEHKDFLKENERIKF